MKKPYVIEIKGLVKFYGKVQALAGVDLEVNKGEIFGFLGPNGAGKTTTIRCMLDTIRPQGGEIRVLGIDPQKDAVGVRSRVGYLPGELSMESNLRVADQLKYFNELRGNASEWKFVTELSQRLELDLDIAIKNLSKGNKQKVGVVQVLMHKPELLIFDEPTSGLDPLMKKEVYALLEEARIEGATIFFSSHNISEVEAIADRVALIREGVIVQEADPEELVGMSIRRMRVRFKEAINTNILTEIDGVSMLSENDGIDIILQVGGEMDKLIKTLAKFPVVDIDLERPSLEEIFLTYYEASEEEEN